MTNFIGVGFGALDDRICAIATSTGLSVIKPGGMTTREAIAFFWAVRESKEQIANGPTAFVAYDASVDFEMLLRDLSAWDKDKLFGVWRAKEDKFNIDTQLYEAGAAAETVDFEGFRLYQLPGKFFRLSRAHRKAMAIYDLASYFEAIPIAAAAEEFLQLPAPPRVERNDLALWRDGLHDQIVARIQSEATIAARLGEKIAATIAPLQIAPRQWYGPSAIASRCLAKWRARGQAKRLTDRNSPTLLLRAIDCAYIGGRVEQIKLGTIQDVRVLDLNSAYAYATTLLSQFYRPLKFTRECDLTVPFSCWLADYALPPSVVLGPLPARAPGGQISFRLKGRGWFWQPEVDYMRRHYSDCFRVRCGYVARKARPGQRIWRNDVVDRTGDPVRFGKDIRAMYDYRLALKAKGDAGEKIIKLALSNLYGKFAQNTGGAYYQCRAWAGWICSFVRVQLLEAVAGIEDQVISFAQDAIHFEGEPRDLRVSLGDGLGEWKRTAYASGLYLAPGIYDLSAEHAANDKSASRGSNLDLDFQRIAKELSDGQASEIQRAFIVGWQLARNAPVKYESSYLQEVSESLRLVPTRLRARNYQAQFNWLKESRTSTINAAFSGLESARYLPQTSTGALRLRLRDRGWS